MTIDFEFPRALWLLLVVPVVWLVGPIGVLGVVARHTRVHALVRSTLLAALAVALSQPVLSLPASRTAIVYLVDVSDSVASRAWTRAADAIDAFNAAVKPDVSRILAFAGHTSSVSDTQALRQMAARGVSEDLGRAVGPESSNLEQALTAARTEIPPGISGRIVLFSDGRQTSGDVTRATARLSAAGVPVFADALAARDLGDTWIADVRVPRMPAVGAPAAIEIVIGAQAAREVDVAVREDGRTIASRRVSATVGTSSVVLDATFASPGAHLIEAAITVDRDVLVENNTLSREVVVAPRPRVLYVHGAAGDAGVAPVALARAGVDVTRARPDELPTQAPALNRWDVVVLSNIARAQVSSGALKALGSWVEELGGGLLFAGGAAVVGESPDRTQPGYRRSEIERVLPVTFDRDDEPEVALVIVLDRSWSMYGPAMELSKSAAEAAANTLTPSQMVGVLTFNNNSDWDVPLARVRDNKATLHDAISRIAASGPTAIYPALEYAYDALTAVRARAKHIVLLSDGQTAPEDFEGLVRKMKAARITVSSVALGPEADVTLLRNIATWGDGRSYVVQAAEQIPEIFVKEAKSAGDSGPDDGKGIVPLSRQSSFFSATAGTLPALSGRNVVTKRPQAIELLGTSRGDPLLSVWQAGLGRTAMFAADLDGGWTREWLAWRGFGSALASVVRSLAVRHSPASALNVSADEAQGGVGALRVRLDVHDDAGDHRNLLTPHVEVRQGDRRVMLPLAQVGPGRYEARAVADTRAPLFFAAPDEASSRVFTVDGAAEYRFGAPDMSLLAAVVQQTGGSTNPTPEALRSARQRSGVARHPLAPWLFGLALLLWPIDIAVRRLRR